MLLKWWKLWSFKVNVEIDLNSAFKIIFWLFDNSCKYCQQNISKFLQYAYIFQIFVTLGKHLLCYAYCYEPPLPKLYFVKISMFKVTITLWRNFRYQFLYFSIRNPITDINASVSSLNRQIVCKQVNFPKLWDLQLRLFNIRMVQVLNDNELLTYL